MSEPRTRFVLCALVAIWLACWPGSAWATARVEGRVPEVFGDALRVPAMAWLDEGEQLLSQDALRRWAPEAVAERLASRMRFEHLDEQQAVGLAQQAFPWLVDRPAGGPPALGRGQRIASFASDRVARVALGGHRRAVIESSEPMALEVSGGHRLPIDLGLARAGSAFVPVRPMVGVSIPERLSEGVQLPELGVSLTPVSASGAVLRGAGSVAAGAGIWYANTQAATDMFVKPTLAGFELASVLRGVDSPEALDFRVRLPAGARMTQPDGDSGPVDIMREGVVIAVIEAPQATDATGTPVPTTMSVQRALLVLNVAARGGEYQWPIAVDPTVIDTERDVNAAGSNWLLSCHLPQCHRWGSELGADSQGAYGPGEYFDVQYETQGESHIYALSAQMAGADYRGRALLQFAHETANGEPSVESTRILGESDSWSAPDAEYCLTPGESECSTAAGHQHNLVWYKQLAIEPGGEIPYELGGDLAEADVYIEQEEPPEITFNTTQNRLPEDPSRENVLLGEERWLGPDSGAVEVKVHDPGIGVSDVYLEQGAWSENVPIYKDGDCKGVQCNENFSTTVTWHPEMYSSCCMKVFAENMTGEPTMKNGFPIEGGWSYTYENIKVDSAPPYGIKISGLPTSGEIMATPHPITVEATDGDGGADSSAGVRSLAVSIDGGANTLVPDAACAPGECTASGKYTIDGEALSEGVHRLIVTATDNVGNVAAKEFTFDVRHATPVPVGPGSVDPTTGQFTLRATDVSLGGTGGVSRVYRSRDLAAGVEGPLGPQWAISLGGGQGLDVLPSGSVVLEGPAGDTTFLRNEKGEFESPTGDGNVKLEAKEKESQTGISEYLLSEATSGTTTRFTLPSGSENTSPKYLDQFGAEAVGLKRPVSAAVESNGDLWVVDQKNDRIVEFSGAGTLLASYGSEGTGDLQFNDPTGIAAGDGVVYVADAGNNRIEELTSGGGFLDAIGWGVSNGSPEFEICKSNCQAGIAGSGNGQLNEPKGLATDSSGDLWVAEAGNNRIEELESDQHFKQKFGEEGSGNGKFNDPTGLAVVGEDVYVAEAGNNRVQELSSSGGYVSQFGEGGSGSGDLDAPQGIAVAAGTGDLYVADSGNDRVQEFSSSGSPITTFGSAGSEAGELSEPTDVAVSAAGAVYVADYANNRIEEWAHRARWVPTIAEGPLRSATTTYAYQAVEVEGKTVIQPSEALAPAPAGVMCTSKLDEASERGCRGLSFEYATKTTATGEKDGEWGEYAGHLARVYFHGWDPATGGMTSTAVAQYEYDSKGWLRAEWDPRITPALKTTYGYDSEGHVTADTPPGQQPWLVHYGALAGDPGTGRLLSLTRPAASNALKNEGAPVNTTPPSAEGSNRSGSWSNSPLSFSYQWEDCVGEATNCTLIAGAVNENYKTQPSDAGYTLRVLVTAENAAGASTVASNPSKPVTIAEPVDPTSFGDTGAESTRLLQPTGLALDGEGDLWVADMGHNRVAKFSSSDTFIASFDPEAMMLEPVSVAVSAVNGDVYVSDRGHDRIDRLEPSGALHSTFGEPGSGPGQLDGPDELAMDASGDVWVADSHNSRVDEFSPQGSYLTSFGSEGTGNGQFKEPTGITVCGGELYVVDAGNERVQKFSLEGEYLGQFATTHVSASGTRPPAQIACEPAGDDLWVNSQSESGGITTSLVREFNAAGAQLYSAGSETPGGVIVGSGGSLYLSNDKENSVVKRAAGYTLENPPPAAPNIGSDAVTTIEYHIPVSGTGLPDLTEAETATWSQSDDPKEGVAIFPPDEPMGWPAKDYTRATIDYFDPQGRMVNVATPGGAITTTEYNDDSEITRTLSAENRATALKNSSTSAERAETLSMSRTYNTEGSELLETVGPEHEVQLADGSDVTARNRIRYFYDEGAPAQTDYGLVTKTTDGALVMSGKDAGKEADVRTTANSYSGVTSRPGQEGIGWTLRKPTSVTTDPGGLSLRTSTVYEPGTGNVTETITPGGASSGPGAVFSTEFGELGLGPGQLESPDAVALDRRGELWVADTANNRIDEFSPSGEFILTVGWGVRKGGAKVEVCEELCRAGSAGDGKGEFSAPQGIAYDPNDDRVYVSDTDNNRIEEFTTGEGDGNSQPGRYKGTFGGQGTGNGQLNSPRGLTIDAQGNIWVADEANNRIEEFNKKGKFADAYGNLVGGKGEGEFTGAGDVTYCAGDLYAVDDGGERVEEFSTSRTPIRTFGGAGKEEGQFTQIGRIACDPENSDLYVTDSAADRVESFTDEGKPVAVFGSSGNGRGQFSDPTGVAVNSTGTAYVLDAGNNRIQEWVPAHGAATHTPHDMKTVYYSTAPNETYQNCGEHQEWANLPCETEPTGQPEGEPLPTTSFTYNMWDEVETTTEEFGTTKRRKSETYDPAGRALTNQTTSSPETDEPLPTVTIRYNEHSGALETERTEANGKSETNTSIDNSLGQLQQYTDAAGDTTSYSYDVDGRIEEVKYGEVDGETASQIYSYDTTTGYMTKLLDSAAGTLTASYNVEGAMTSEAYPDGLTAKYTISAIGQGTSLEYKKHDDCGTTCDWFKQSIIPSIHGEVLAQTSTLANDTYTFDSAGRLTEEQEEPTGKGCTTRIYGYDEESDRTSVTTRDPTGGGECATEGGATETYTYDTADRLTGRGVSYETFGNTTKLPAGDAGGHELTNTYYVDNQVATQTQDEKMIAYSYDPAGRTLETETTAGKTTTTVVSHYAGPGDAVTWTTEGANTWTRNIPGIGGTLTAIQSSSISEPTVLELHNLQGDIVAKAALSDTETKLLSTYNSGAFGVPSEGPPPKYAWLGADGLTTELPTGIATNNGASYVPQIARSLQTAPIISPGALPDGTGSAAPYTAQISAWSIALSETQSAGALAEYTAKQEALKKEAEEACWQEGEYTCNYTEIDPECSLHAEITGNGKGVVSAIGWGTCAPDLLPRYSEIEVCLYIEPEEDGLFDAPDGGGCEIAESGYNVHTKQKAGRSGSILASVSTKCEGETRYQAWAWFWIPGAKGPTVRQEWTPSWRCGKSKLEEIEEWTELLGEFEPPIGIPG